MGTVWMPMTRMEPKSWLLGNGDVVQEPALEMTSTGRKVRVAGTTQSVFSNDLDSLLGQAVQEIAALKQTHVWIETTGGVQRVVERQAGYDPASEKAKLHLVHDPTNGGGHTTLWWRFKDQNTPYEALLTVKLTKVRSHGSVNAQQMSVFLTIPGRMYYDPACSKSAWNITSDSFPDVTNALHHLDSGNTTYKWQEFFRDNKPNWPSEVLGTSNHQHARAAVTSLLQTVREIEELESIQVPDLGDPYTPAWRTLDLYDTNVNAELLSDLTEYLDGAPTIEQAAELYQKMLETLRSVGITVQGKDPNDFMAALLAGEKATLNMEVYALAEENQQVDSNHKLSVHLPTGAFIVECVHHEVDKNTVAEKWEEALTMASLTGEEDTLLAYAREYAKANNARRTKQILKERKG